MAETEPISDRVPDDSARASSTGTEEKTHWSQVAKAVSHCGAGCTLGDILGEWLVFALGFTLANKALFADFLFDFAFAWMLGIVFQYFTIVPMRRLDFRRGLWAAIKADTLSIVAFQVGLFAGMAFYQEVLFADPGPYTGTRSYCGIGDHADQGMTAGFFVEGPFTGS